MSSIRTEVSQQINFYGTAVDSQDFCQTGLQEQGFGLTKWGVRYWEWHLGQVGSLTYLIWRLPKNRGALLGAHIQRVLVCGVLIGVVPLFGETIISFGIATL